MRSDKPVVFDLDYCGFLSLHTTTRLGGCCLDDCQNSLVHLVSLFLTPFLNPYDITDMRECENAEIEKTRAHTHTHTHTHTHAHTPKKTNVTSAYIIHFPSTSSLPTNPFRTHPNLAFCLRDPSVFIVGWASRVGEALGIADLIAATYHHCTPIWPNGRIFHQPRFP